MPRNWPHLSHWLHVKHGQYAGADTESFCELGGGGGGGGGWGGGVTSIYSYVGVATKVGEEPPGSWAKLHLFNNFTTC